MQSLRGATSLAAATLFAVGCTSGVNAAPAGAAASATSATDGASPSKLTWANYANVKKRVELRPSELTYQTVPWRRSAIQGLRDAQTQDKPLLLWLYFGGPRGAC